MPVVPPDVTLFHTAGFGVVGVAQLLKSSEKLDVTYPSPKSVTVSPQVISISSSTQQIATGTTWEFDIKDVNNITTELKSIDTGLVTEPTEDQLFDEVKKIEEKENKQIDYSALTVTELRKQVSERGLATNLKSLKKSDLVDLLK